MWQGTTVFRYSKHMIARLLVVFGAVAAAWGASAGVDPGGRAGRDPVVDVAPRRSTLSDSALAELAAGRAWHAARMMRAERAQDGTPEDVLLLARAEAGWENWAGVLELLESADGLEGGDGAGLYLLARALEVAGRPAEAAAAYGRFSELVGRSEPNRGPWPRSASSWRRQPFGVGAPSS